MGIKGGFETIQPLELQIDAPDSAVTVLEGGNIYGRVNITKLNTNQNSYIFKDPSQSYGAYIDGAIAVGDAPTPTEEKDSFGFYSNLNGARYAFVQSDNFDEDTTKLRSQNNQTNYYGIFAKQNFNLSGNFYTQGKRTSGQVDVENLAGIYIGTNNKLTTPLIINIEDNTNLSVKGHSSLDRSGITFGIIVDNQDTQINISNDKMFAMRFYDDQGHQTEYIGFDIKNATLTIPKPNNGQKIVVDTYENVQNKHSKKTTIMRLNNGEFAGELDLYVDGERQSSILAFDQIYGLHSLGESTIDGRIILKNGVFKDIINQSAISGRYMTAPVTLIYNDSDSTLTFKQNSLFYSEAYRTDDSTDSGLSLVGNRYLIKNYGTIVFEAGAKAIFGQEYSKLDDISYDGIYIAPYPQNKTTKINTASMNFKGNAGISVAGGATLDMTLSGGSLEFDGSNGGEEMIAFNALKSTDPNVAQGKINLTIKGLNSSIIFTKAQGGQLESFVSLESNPISSSSPDKNTIVDLAGSSQSREANGKLATRSLTIQNANIKNVNFVAYINPNISTNDVTITNFDGCAYSDSSGGMASNGASDRIIIEKDLGRSGNNTLSIAVAPNQSTRNISGYMLVGQVKTDSNITFNNLRNGDSQNITTYSGLRTTTLTLHRSDVGGYSYYYVTSAQDSTTPPSGGGSSGGSSGEGSSGGGSGSGGGDSGSTGGSTGGGDSGSTGGGDGGNTGGGGETDGSGGGSSGGNGSGGGEITPPDTGNGGDSNAGGSEGTTPPSNPDLPVIDAPNVGVAPLTRSAFHTNFTLMSSTLNSLNKRLGDIRSLEVSDGVWARVFVGEEVFKDALQTTALYTSIQAGYDHAMDIKGATNFIGFALAWVGSDATSQEDSYQVSPIDFINGHNTTKTNGVELALYDSYLSSFGLYTDSIVKFGYYSSDVSMPVMKDFTLDNFSFSLSQEVGYQARLGEKSEWLITPQAEVAYAYFSGSNATQNLLMAGVDNIMDISQDALNLLRMRFGVDWGYAFDGWSEIVSKADIHLGTSYEYDVISGGDMTYSLPNMGKVKEKGMGSNGRFVLNIGTNVYIKDAVSLYFDFEKSFGDVMYKNYQANLGMRYSFGEKIRASQEMPKDNSAPLSVPEKQTNQEEK